MRPAVFVLLLFVSACARGADNDVVRPPESGFRGMPNPSGCYMQVWEFADFMGTSDYINGPREYASLRQMPNNRTWQNRINSVRVGPTAAVTVFTEENYRGQVLQLPPESSHPQFSEGFSAQIESLRVSCKDK